MNYWSDGTPRSTGNAFDAPEPAKPETRQQRRNRLHKEATARRKTMEMILKPSKTYEIPNQADADKSRRIKGKP